MGSPSASSRCSSGPGVFLHVQLPLGLANISATHLPIARWPNAFGCTDSCASPWQQPVFTQRTHSCVTGFGPPDPTSEEFLWHISWPFNESRTSRNCTPFSAATDRMPSTMSGVATFFAQLKSAS